MKSFTKQESKSTTAVALTQYLTFLLGTDLYAINILLVKEIINLPLLTPISNAPSYILGMTHLYENLVPILDLGKLLAETHPGAKTADLTTTDEKNMVVIIKTNEKYVGLIVGSVFDIVALAPQEIKPAPEFFAELPCNFVQQVGVKDDKLLMILDTQRLLDCKELQSLHAVM